MSIDHFEEERIVYLLISDHGETDELEGVFTSIEKAKEHWKDQKNLEYVKECYILEKYILDWPHAKENLGKMIYLK